MRAMSSEGRRELDGIGGEVRAAFNFFTVAVCVMSRGWGVFVRRNTGKEWIGYPGALLAVLAFIVAAFSKTLLDQRVMLAYLVVFLAACFCQRVAQTIRWVNRVRMHSHYVGDSMFSRWFPAMPTWGVKLFIEPFILGSVSAALGALTGSRVLGVFLLFCAASLWLEEHLLVARDRKLKDELRDRIIEQEIIAEDLE
jgi:hypothetical protein